MPGRKPIEIDYEEVDRLIKLGNYYCNNFEILMKNFC